LKYGKNPT
jgi:hypothetical protein